MGDLHQKSGKDSIFALKRRSVSVDHIESEGLILDIGGGGEGVIGRLEGDRVIALDRRLDELLEAPPGPMKLVADARQLPFTDGAFDTVTSFFTMMFIARAELPAVFAETHRVLVPGGRMILWDSELPPKTDSSLDIVAFRLTAHLPEETIRTAYGRRWETGHRHLQLYRTLGEIAGFYLKQESEKDGVIHLTFEKTS